MTITTDTKLTRAIGKAINNANEAAYELEEMGASPEVVRLVRPLAVEAEKFKPAHTQAYLIEVGDKIEIGGHLAEIIAVEVGSESVLAHALDLLNRVYELKLKRTHPLTIQKRIREKSDA